MRIPAHTPATATIVPSPNGMWKRRPSARFRRSSSTDAAISRMAPSTNEKGPSVLTASRMAPTASTRCSTPSRRQVSATVSFGCGSERAASAIPRVELVPVADLVLALLPAEEDLLAVTDRWEVDEAAVEVA